MSAAIPYWVLTVFFFFSNLLAKNYISLFCCFSLNKHHFTSSRGLYFVLYELPVQTLTHFSIFLIKLQSTLSLSFFFFFLNLFRATLAAYGSSQARGQIRVAAMPQPQPHQIQTSSVIYTTAYNNVGSFLFVCFLSFCLFWGHTLSIWRFPG